MAEVNYLCQGNEHWVGTFDYNQEKKKMASEASGHQLVYYKLKKYAIFKLHIKFVFYLLLRDS